MIVLRICKEFTSSVVCNETCLLQTGEQTVCKHFSVEYFLDKPYFEFLTNLLFKTDIT